MPCKPNHHRLLGAPRRSALARHKLDRETFSAMPDPRWFSPGNRNPA